MAEDIYVLTKTTLLDFARHVSLNYYPGDEFDHRNRVHMSSNRLQMSTEARRQPVALEEANTLKIQLPGDYAARQVLLREMMLKRKEGTFLLMDDMMLSMKESSNLNTSSLSWLTLKDESSRRICYTLQIISDCIYRDAFMDSRMHGFEDPKNRFIAYVKWVTKEQGKARVVANGQVYDHKDNKVATIRCSVVRTANPDLEVMVAGLSNAKVLGEHALPFTLPKKKMK
jgi:hypothetical protein